jgi:hypothetical protein
MYVVPQVVNETRLSPRYQAFEWQVRDVRGLKEYLDHWNAEQASSVAHANQGHSTDDGGHNNVPELLRESPIIGDGKFKLEVCACTCG